MILAFLDPTYAWLPGTVFGVLIGLWGAAFGMARGLGKGGPGLIAALRTIYWLLLAAAFVMLQLGVTAFASEETQPVWMGWLLPGFVGCISLGVLYPVIKSSGKGSGGSSHASAPPPSIREREASQQDAVSKDRSPE